MIESNYKTSLTIFDQIPQYIKNNDSYLPFIEFIQAYYEWLAQTNNVEDRAKNLSNYKDIDSTLTEFENYFFNEYLHYFPEECLVDKRKLVKFSKQIYERKSTPASFKFLFRAIYNSECEAFETREYVLKASDGKWATSRSIKLKTLDPRFLLIDNYLVFGEDSNAVASIEKSKVNGTKIEIFFSEVNRDFISGEFIRIIDSNFNNVIIDGDILRTKVVGLVREVIVDNVYKGLNYRVGDPVVLYGGLNPEIEEPIKAKAEVGSVFEGGIGNINLVNGSQGFRLYPNTAVEFIGGGGTGADARIIGVDYNDPFEVSLISIDVISNYRSIRLDFPNYAFSNNFTANANTRLIDAFKTVTFDTYPITNIGIYNKGSGYSSIPKVDVLSFYQTEDYTNTTLNTLKILGPIQIINGGQNYLANDKIVFTNGSGIGAYANVVSVDYTGKITEVDYVYNYSGGEIYPKGGMGYSSLPSVSVNSVSGNGAILAVNSVVGDGEIVNVTTDSIGQVRSVTIVEEGEDYLSPPEVSFKVVDVIIRGVDISDIPKSGLVAYQKYNSTKTFSSYVDVVEVLSFQENIYTLRLYNFNGLLSETNSEIIIDKNSEDDEFYKVDIVTSYNTGRFINGVLYYGNGQAKATSKLLTGTVAYDGRYLNKDGQLSSYSRLQNEIYNNFTYFVDVEKSFNDYKNLVLNLLNPAGSKFVGKNDLKLSGSFDYEYLKFGITNYYNLKYFFGSSANGTLIMTDNYSSNTIQMRNLNYANLTSVALSNTFIKMKNNSTSYSYVDVLVEKVLFMDFPEVGSPFYQEDANNPTFIGFFESATKLEGSEYYKIRLVNYLGEITVTKNSRIYCDLYTLNDKNYFYSIIVDSYTPYINGVYYYDNRETLYSKVISANNTSNTIILQDSFIMRYSNVANGYSSANSLILTDLTGFFDRINNGNYSSENKLKDIVFVGDLVSTQNNQNMVVDSIDYDNKILYFSTTLNPVGNSNYPTLISVTRNFNSDDISIEYLIQ